MKSFTPFIDDRFWSKVRFTDSCWIWTGHTDECGYGRVTRRSINRHNMGAHRYVMTVLNGPIPHGMVVMHTCDNPPCVNPEHLRIGTVAENVADMAQKDRHGKISIDSESVLEIIKRYKNGEKQMSLALEFGVSQQAISKYVSGTRRGQ